MQNPYVTMGLIAMWDGEWNAGWGVHNAHAMTWKNLLGDSTYDLPVYSGASGYASVPTWSATGPTQTTNLPFYFRKDSGFGGIYTLLENGEATVEFVTTYSQISNNGGQGVLFYNTTPSRIVVIDPANNSTAKGYVVNWRFSTWSSYASVSIQKSAYLPQNKLSEQVIGLHTVTLSVRSSSAADVYVDAINVHTLIGDPAYTRTWSGMRIMTCPNTRGTYHCCRIYSRVLTAEDIAANYAVDKERFNLP